MKVMTTAALIGAVVLLSACTASGPAWCTGLFLP